MYIVKELLLLLEIILFTTVEMKGLNKVPEIIESQFESRKEDRMSENSFYAEEINETIKERIMGKSYPKDCSIELSQLCYLNVLYYGFDNETHQGELIVNKIIKEDVLSIFKELYRIHYPIERMQLIDDYDADDIKSMEANNTSAFNYRVIAGTKKLSKHAFGLAIDINPLYNPYVKNIGNTISISPETAKPYVDRSLDCPYYITKGDVVYQLFVSHGFDWGGDWETTKDYQHFDKADR